MSAVRGGQKPSVVSIAGWRGGGCWVLGAGFWRRKLYAGFVAGEFGEGREFSSDCDQKPANLQNHPVSRQAGGPVRGPGRFWERTWVSRCCTIPVAPAAAAKTAGVNGALQPVAKHGSRPCAQFSDDKVVRILQHLDLV